MMLKVKVFEGVHKTVIEDEISQWLYETRKELGVYLKNIEIVSTSQSQDGE